MPRVQTETELTEYSAELLFGFLKYSAEYQYCKKCPIWPKIGQE